MEEKKYLPIAQALNEIMKEVGAVKKLERNNAQGTGFNFRGIDAVVNAVSPALQKYGVVVVPSVESDVYETVEIGRNRTQMGHVRLRVKYTFIGGNGDAIATTVASEAMDSGDKATAKAMSVAFRTALLQALALPTDEPDPDSQSYERSSAEDVISASAIMTQIDRATTVQDLAEVGQYITQHRNSYPANLVEQFRTKFKEQQSKLSPAKEDASETESESSESDDLARNPV